MEYICEHCNNTYSSRQSRWNHIKKYHKLPVTNCNTNVHLCNTNVTKIINCKICNEEFNNRQSKWRHEKICQNKDTEKYLQLEKQNEELKQEMIELKNLIQKSLKIHPKTLQKINKQLVNGNVVNGTVNNNYIVQIGNEKLNEVLTDNEKLSILNKKYNSINELIQKVHVSSDDRYKKFIRLVRENF